GLVACYSTLEPVASATAALWEMARVLRPEGMLYLHPPSPAACYESHYKILWAPGLPQAAARAYLRARGRPTQFLATLRLVGAAESLSALHAAGRRDRRALHRHRDRPAGRAPPPPPRPH